MGLPLTTYKFYDNGGGLNVKSSPTKGPEDEATISLNVDYSIDGAFFTRNGSTITNVSGGIPAQMAGAPKTLLMFDYRKSDGTAVQIVCAGTTIKHGLATPTNAVTGLSATLPYPDIEFQVTLDDEYAFWGNGVDTNLKFNGTTWTNWSIVAPANPIVIDDGAGLLPAGDYRYYIAFVRYDTATDTIQQIGDLNPVAQSVTIAVNHKIKITRPVSTDPQVNGWVIYRQSPSLGGVYYQVINSLGEPVIIPIATADYSDNIMADGTNEAEFDNQPAPITAVFEEYLGRMYIVDYRSTPDGRKTDVFYSKKDKPWNVPDTSFFIFDGPVRCIRRLYGALIFGTDRSLWVLDGDIATNTPRRISSIIGIFNNRCMVGETAGYILATNKKFYSLHPTDFSQSEIRTDDPSSIKIDPIFAQIPSTASESICMEYYTSPSVAKVMISVSYLNQTSTQNNTLIIYNETQSILKQKPVWQLWDNIKASALRQFVIDGTINLYSGDYNGFLWKLDDSTLNGDGAEQNGIATASTNTTLTDSTKTWVVNAFVGMTVRIFTTSGQDQVRTIVSNTINQVTIDIPWTMNPTANVSEYTIGGYSVQHFTNWKALNQSYDDLKQLWFIWVNANASGNYEIDLIVQRDFSPTLNADQILPLNLQGGAPLWGAFIWGAVLWGGQAVFQERLRKFLRFRAIRIGFRNRKAGQPFQINGLSLSAQNKKLFFKTPS